MDKLRFVMAHQEARRRAITAVAEAPPGYRVTIEPPKRTLDQSALFHALCGDFEKAGIEWAGKKRSAAEWKVLLVSAHAVATGLMGEVVTGIEGELVSIRESTAAMTKSRSSSLIEYTKAQKALLMGDDE